MRNIMADEHITLEIRALSEVYRKNDGRPGQFPVSPYKLAREFKLGESEVLKSMKMLRIEGYLTRQGDENPLGAYADINSFFNLTDDGKKHFEELCDAFEPDGAQDTILDVLEDIGQSNISRIEKKLSDAGEPIDEDTLTELLDELVVYHLVDKEGPPYGLVKYSVH